jgi:hypothetical protein
VGLGATHPEHLLEHEATPGGEIQELHAVEHPAGSRCHVAPDHLALEPHTPEIGLEPQLDLRRDLERLGQLDTRASLAQVPRPADAHPLPRGSPPLVIEGKLDQIPEEGTGWIMLGHADYLAVHRYSWALCPFPEIPGAYRIVPESLGLSLRP